MLVGVLNHLRHTVCRAIKHTHTHTDRPRPESSVPSLRVVDVVARQFYCVHLRPTDNTTS